MNIIVKRLRVEGFIVLDHGNDFPAYFKQLFELKAAGKLKIHNDVREGIENAGTALGDLFSGAHVGKLMVKVH